MVVLSTTACGCVRNARRLCGNTELFNVYLLPTSLLQFSGECLLQVTRTELSLIDAHHPHTVVAYWPLSTIRQYGHPKNENFTFIAGRLIITSLTPTAANVTSCPHLLLSAGTRWTGRASRPQLSVDIAYRWGDQQLTRRTSLLLSIDGTDGQTPDRYIDHALHTLGAASITRLPKLIWHKAASPPQTHSFVVHIAYNGSAHVPPFNTWFLRLPNRFNICSAVFGTAHSSSNTAVGRISD